MYKVHCPNPSISEKYLAFPDTVNLLDVQVKFYACETHDLD